VSFPVLREDSLTIPETTRGEIQAFYNRWEEVYPLQFFPVHSLGLTMNMLHRQSSLIYEIQEGG